MANLTTSSNTDASSSNSRAVSASSYFVADDGNLYLTSTSDLNGNPLPIREEEVVSSQMIPNQMTSYSLEQLTNWMQNLSEQIVGLQSSVNLIMKNTPLKALENSSGQCPECPHCNPIILEQARNMEFSQIENEADLIALEEKLESDALFRNQMINFCYNIIGLSRAEAELTTCCLELSRALFTKTFWGQTTWLGSTKTGSNQFQLSRHTIFLDFFKSVIRKTTKATPADTV